MAWLAISADDVDTVLSAEEKGKITGSFIGTETVPDTIQKIVAHVRGYVAKCTELPADVSLIPSELEWTTLVLVRHALATRLAGSECILTEVRMDEYHKACQHLRDVGACKVDIEPVSESCNLTENTANEDLKSSSYSVGDSCFGGNVAMEIC